MCLAFALLVACITLHASAEGTPTFAIGTADAQAGETVDIPILIENNPGIIALRVTVTFDPGVLTLQNVTNESLFSEGVFTPGGSYNTASYNILWENGTGENATANGTFATLTFLVAEDAPVGDTAISVSYSPSSTFNRDLNEVTFDTRAGAVTIVPNETGGWSFSEDCTLYTFESEASGIQYVAGLDITYPVISDFVETTGGWSFEIELNEEGMESTGAKLVIFDENGSVVEEYWSVLFGDINGDGVFDGIDIALINSLIGSTLDTPWAEYAVADEFPQSFAADADHDYNVDGMDMVCIRCQIGSTEDIDQILL